MRAVRWRFALALMMLASTARAGAPTVVFADRDDDDANGRADCDDLSQRRVPADVHWSDPGRVPRRILGIEGSGLRLFVDGEPLEAGPFTAPVVARRMGIQGVHAGSAIVHFEEGAAEFAILDVVAMDAASERVDLATSHASIGRLLPWELGGGASPDRDEDALRWVVVGPAGTLPSELDVASLRPDGTPLDMLEGVRLKPTECPSGIEGSFECRASALIRAAADLVDRSHPGSAARSLQAEVGGRLVVRVGGQKATSIRVGGPRHSAVGPIERYRARLRVRILRTTRGGPVAIGADASDAIALAREQVRAASGLWGQCGIVFPSDEELDVAVVDPPPTHLLALGSELGLPSSGGKFAFRVGRKAIGTVIGPGLSPVSAAQLVAAAVNRTGFRATVSVNPLTDKAAWRTADVLVRRADGALAELSRVGDEPLCTDASLGVSLGQVVLEDGLSHFTDYDSSAGTVEERSLVKAFSDGDPTSIEVFVIPSFRASGRIGESFLSTDGSALQNAVVMDRLGVRVGAVAYALAHELGHVLLNVAGHPDDFGVDSSGSLMDSDATDPTIFGPRRLSAEECARAIRESGPGSRQSLLEPWPLYRRAADVRTLRGGANPR